MPALRAALTTWRRGDILDVAILTSGPPLSRLDYACVKHASPEWASLCASIVPKGVMECTRACVLGPPRSPVDSFVYKTGVYRQVSPDETPEQLLDDGVVHPGAVLDYPKIKVYFLYGPAGLRRTSAYRSDLRDQGDQPEEHSIRAPHTSRASGHKNGDRARHVRR